MLTALFNLVWITQKSKWTNLFECQGKMFLSIEKVLEKISEDQPSMHCLIVLLHIFEKYDKTKLELNSSQNFKAMV